MIDNNASLQAIRATFADMAADFASRASVFVEGQYIQVLADESQGGKQTLYRSIAHQASFIGVTGSSNPGASVSTQTDAFVSTDDPYTLTFVPDGNLFAVFFDGVEQPAANYSVAGKIVTLDAGVDTSLFDTTRIIYTH